MSEPVGPAESFNVGSKDAVQPAPVPPMPGDKLYITSVAFTKLLRILNSPIPTLIFSVTVSGASPN